MDFDAFIETAWKDHADQAEAVAERLARAAADEIPTPAHAIALAQLATHVFGEHLGRCDDGIALLLALGQASAAKNEEAARAIERNVAVLRLVGGDETAPAFFTEQDRAAVLAGAAAALAGRGDLVRAGACLAQAQSLAAELAASSPAQRVLAVAGNNIAATLEEKTQLDPGQTAAMLKAARIGLESWKIAGTWLEEERAHWMLARCLAKAGEPEAALHHATVCREICVAHQAPAFEHFFACALLAQVHTALGAESAAATSRRAALDWHAQLSEEERGWCEQEFAALAP